MKPQELRIGNWVFEALNQRNEEFATAKVIAAHLHNTTFLKPIPLTPEWLEEFGFKFDNDPDSIGGFIKNGVHIWDYNGKHWICDMADQQGISQDHFQHVHQLQNLYFALTDEEL